MIFQSDAEKEFIAGGGANNLSQQWEVVAPTLLASAAVTLEFHSFTWPYTESTADSWLGRVEALP